MKILDRGQLEKAGELAWETYRQEIGGKAWNGDPLPDWTTMRNDPAKQKIVRSWIAVATRMENYWSEVNAYNARCGHPGPEGSPGDGEHGEVRVNPGPING